LFKNKKDVNENLYVLLKELGENRQLVLLMLRSIRRKTSINQIINNLMNLVSKLLRFNLVVRKKM